MVRWFIQSMSYMSTQIIYSMCRILPDLVLSHLCGYVSGYKHMFLALCQSRDLLRVIIIRKKAAEGSFDVETHGIDELSKVGIKNLKLQYMRIVSTKSLAPLTDLKYLTLVNIYGMLSLHCLPRKLKHLTVDWCTDVKCLAPLLQLKNLTYLKLVNLKCTSLSTLPPNLTYLTVDYLRVLKSLDVLPTGLTQLKLYECHRIQSLSQLGNLQSLTLLDLYYLPEINCLQPLASLTSLQDLILRGLPQITSLEPLTNITGLRNLDLHLLPQIRQLEPLANLKGLRHLMLCQLHEVRSLRPIKYLKALEDLKVQGCRYLDDLL